MGPGGQAPSASANAAVAAASRALASSSAPEAVNDHGVSARPLAIASPASVNTTALLVLVPTSRPTKSVLRISIPCAYELAYMDTDGYSCVSLADCQEGVSHTEATRQAPAPAPITCRPPGRTHRCPSPEPPVPWPARTARA